MKFGVSYRYRHIIKKKEIDWFCGKLINLHIAVLPFGRGADPNIWSYLENTPKGVTIHIIDDGIDTGPILMQRHVDIDVWHDTLSSSYDKLSRVMEFLFINNCKNILNGKIEAEPQNNKEGSFHYSMEKEAYSHLWAEKGWETPVSDLIGKAIQPGS
ncbi:formyltransferase family protein [Chitiniphilus eburneus]|uniref:formyltransferase family protein n=1 Tax=Chitiniphilus eburneus TaxID=2571148 RepID=UPI002482140E